MSVYKRRPRLTQRTFATFVAGLPKVPRTLEDARCAVTALALERERWNMTTVARQLGTDRRTLYRMCERWGLDVARERARVTLEADRG